MSHSPSSSASDKTLTPRSSPAPAPALTHRNHSTSSYSSSSPSELLQGGMAAALTSSHSRPSTLSHHHHQSHPLSSSRSPFAFDDAASSPASLRSQNVDRSGSQSGPMSSASQYQHQQRNNQGFSPSSSSAAPSNRTILNSPSTSTATMTNPVMAAMSSGGANLHPRTAHSSTSGLKPSRSGNGGATSSSSSSKERPGSHRKRSSSIVIVQKIEQSQEELLDQAAGFNANADWVNHKGAWVIHVVLILLGKILLDVVPGMRQDASWTIVNLGYIAISYLMFHHVTGTPFDSNAGAYDQLTLWEQIDEGAQYTPAKKWLTSVPIGVFLISTHYTKYNLSLFALNFGATFFVLLPKLPLLHRQRFKVFPGMGGQVGGISGSNSPYPSRPNTPAMTY